MDKVALITGASSGIGEGIARELASAGVRVLLGARRTDRLAKLADELRSAGSTVEFMSLDVTDRSSATAFAERAVSLWGRIDILVNNAGGLFARKTLAELDESFYDLVMNVNFKATVFVMQAFEPVMGKGASIINISSQAARDGGGGGSSLYASSKGAVTTFTRAMAKNSDPRESESMQYALV